MIFSLETVTNKSADLILFFPTHMTVILVVDKRVYAEQNSSLDIIDDIHCHSHRDRTDGLAVAGNPESSFTGYH